MKKELSDEEKEKKLVERIVKLSKEGLNEEDISEQLKKDFPNETDIFGIISDKIRIQQVIGQY